MAEESWLSVNYHFPSTSSLRLSTSSASSTLAMPAPGPATVRLAIIRTGIELYGVEFVRDKLFHELCSTEIRIRPPEEVYITQQIIKGLKYVRKLNAKIDITEAPFNRSYACAKGNMTIFVRQPIENYDCFVNVLQNIGYWGQASSFATCLSIEHETPIQGETATPLSEIFSSTQINGFYCCYVTEMARQEVEWDELFYTPNKESFLKKQLYIWPMRCENYGGKIHLIRTSISM